MYRFAYEKLLKWKQSKDKKPLIVEGVRQVGKTWLIKEFGKKEYEKCIYVNCDNNPILEGIFVDYDIERIIRFLSATYDTNIDEENTLIIFDEIQEINRGLASLKYFNEDSNYHIIASGSLLGMAIHEGTGFPVGNVDIIRLYPLSFAEFLLANGNTELVKYIETNRWDELSILNQMFIELLRQYYYVGGMPEAVKEYVETKDIIKVRKVHNNILRSYELDISKHATRTDIPKINRVWESLPSQLAKENKKFIYGAIKSGARAREYENALEWLNSAGLINIVRRINKLEKPLKFYEDLSSFKIFVCDLGLLGAMLKVKARDVLASNKAFVEYKGAFTEQYVAQEFVCNVPKNLYYYTNKNSTMELDFVFEDENLYLIEVKAEENLRSKSLKASLEKAKNAKAIRFSMTNYYEQDKLTNVPLYLVGEWLKANSEKE